MAYAASPLCERLLVGDLTEPENDCATASLNSLKAAKYKEWSAECIKFAMQAVVKRECSS